MHLRSIALKGFKSFPDRTRLDFAPGVSVIVGPNGSGKSNITEAVLWALGEQSPLAVRGQSMQDVIFAGGPGLPSRQSAEVEVVIDDAGGELRSDFSEVSIVRRLDRSGGGEYRLNGARCRLSDVLEVLSDSGLGKEMHSVVSQGRVESIVHSQARDRRLLIEEAAGLGKHRRRRRSAELKLARTDANLARALDVEREARSRLRPLKRQAEAAELHERLERQALEARLELAGDHVLRARGERVAAEAEAVAARGERGRADEALAAVAARRQAAEESLAAHSETRERLSRRVFAAGSAHERIALRLERARELERSTADGRARRSAELEGLPAGDHSAGPHAYGRVAELEQALRSLESERDERRQAAAARIAVERESLDRVRDERRAAAEREREALERADRECDSARARLREAHRRVESERRAAAQTGGRLATVLQFLRTAGSAPSAHTTLADELGVEPEYRLALAAVLGSRLRAPVVEALTAGERLLDEAGADGGEALVTPGPRDADAEETERRTRRPALPPGAERLLDHVRPAPAVAMLAERLLGDAWVVPDLALLPAGFDGVAVTRAGRALRAGSGELRQVVQADEGRLLDEVARRDELIAASEDRARAVAATEADAERLAQSVAAADGVRDAAEGTLRAARRAAQEAADAADAAERAQRRALEEPDGDTEDACHAHLLAELGSERRLLEAEARERRERLARRERLVRRIEGDGMVLASAARVAAALDDAGTAVAGHHQVIEAEWRTGAAAGEQAAAALRRYAAEEAELQATLRRVSEVVTAAEVRAQRARDAAAEAEDELARVAERLAVEPAVARDPLADERRDELDARLERLARRREQLGPVNPLAQSEYEEAVSHVEELEAQREDLETALAELQGLIRDTDRRIRQAFDETFEATARNFEEVVAHLFPGGRGRLTLVRPDGPRSVLGGEAASKPGPVSEGEDEPDPTAGREPGVDLEVTPAGKSARRLSLLSGGEKSLVALAFLFAVFLARPCPFYILDEVEAALDDLNIDRFLELVRRYSDRAQFIVVTHQRRTMDAADRVYGVSMGSDGVSKVVSRRLARPPEPRAPGEPRSPSTGAEAAA